MTGPDVICLIAARSGSSATLSSVIIQRQCKGLLRALRGWRHSIAPPIAAAMTSETKDDAAGVLADVRGRISRAAKDAGRGVDDVAQIGRASCRERVCQYV